ncbi:hypothetical protein [Curtobacterium poinsettiae]|uniref:hypothetical protein n=1 Tax=Curtobacterium TaxID=2034 RepID=UPI00217E352A|nr:hypothetical protein [Curtobacterium flaccumfaciens]MCS6561760.1 hypothetical protein [Curtobacterium flaccumfaciens pv. poinsettiae]UXN28911.1 hypothetical protein N8D75_00960 [Curtobacterium flaccumfaciens]
MPSAAWLLALAAMLLVAASAHLAARSEPGGRWVPLLVVGVVGAVVTGSPTRLWPLPAIWLVATLLALTGDAPVDPSYTRVALVVGAVVLLVAIAVDLRLVLRARRRRGAA